MFVTNHVLAGALVGTVVRRRPVAAFAIGVATHVAMDLTPHWGLGPTEVRDGEHFYRVARRDGLLGLAVVGAVATFGVPPRDTLAAGIVGAAILDADKPFQHFLGMDPFPRWLMRFHAWIQNESPEGIVNEVIAGVLLAGAVTELTRRRRRAQPRRGRGGV
jgi:hypothetical protein